MRALKGIASLLAISVPVAFLGSCGGNNVFEGMADKSSQEACRYQTTKDLDSGNYDAVLSSNCADRLQRGAAYMGKAGFDIKNIINNLIEGKDRSDQLNTYLKALVPEVTSDSLTSLEKAIEEYDDVLAGDPLYKDAQFYLSLAQTSYSLSLLKTAIVSPELFGTTQGGISECDLNGNNVPDEADATACALSLSGTLLNSPTCTVGGTSYSYTAKDLNFIGKRGTYRGIEVQIPTSRQQSGCMDKYKKVFYKKDNLYYVATTAGSCKSSGEDWPCPVETEGQARDLVDMIDKNIERAVDVIKNLLPPGTDVRKAIEEVRQNACEGDKCDSKEIAEYIQKYLSTKK